MNHGPAAGTGLALLSRVLFSKFERRQFPRFHVRWTPDTGQPRHEAFEVRNISLGGFAIESPWLFQSGEEHELEFTLRDGRQVTIRARAIHSVAADPPADPPRFQTGFSFVRTAADEPIIAELVNSILEASASSAPNVPIGSA